MDMLKRLHLDPEDYLDDRGNVRPEIRQVLVSLYHERRAERQAPRSARPAQVVESKPILRRIQPPENRWPENRLSPQEFGEVCDRTHYGAKFKRVDEMAYKVYCIECGRDFYDRMEDRHLERRQLICPWCGKSRYVFYSEM